LEKISVITLGYFFLRSRKNPAEKYVQWHKDMKRILARFLKVIDTISLLKNEMNSIHSCLRKKIRDFIHEIAFLLLGVGRRIPKCSCGQQTYFSKSFYF